MGSEVNENLENQQKRKIIWIEEVQNVQVFIKFDISKECCIRITNILVGARKLKQRPVILNPSLDLCAKDY